MSVSKLQEDSCDPPRLWMEQAALVRSGPSSVARITAALQSDPISTSSTNLRFKPQTQTRVPHLEHQDLAVVHSQQAIPTKVFTLQARCLRQVCHQVVFAPNYGGACGEAQAGLSMSN